MSSNAFNYLALLAALVVGYGMFVSNSDPDAMTPNVVGVMQGYYLRDAVITESTPEGTPHFRVAASEVAQNLQDKTVAMGNMRVDYLTSKSEQSNKSGTPAHWVLNADRGTALENFHKLALQGNVQAHNLGAPQAIVFDTYSLDIDMNKETAKSSDVVRIGIDTNKVNGRGFFADLNRESFTFDSNVGLKLAQAEVPASNTASQLPDSFTAKKASGDGSCVTMTGVESKSPPFVKADELKTCGREIANNKIDLNGDVSVELPKSGSLTADKAIVSLRNRSVAHAHVEAGSPEKLVEFQHRAKGSDKWVRGRASMIDYDVEQSTLHLEGKVWLSNEYGEWKWDQLDYNLATENWRGKNLDGILNRRQKNSGAPVTENP